MKRLTLALLSCGLMIVAAGCCCHRPNPCNPCGPVYGASYSSPMTSPVAYYPGIVTASAATCDCAPTF